MFFNSFVFASFLAICLVLYLALQVGGRHRAQNRMLLVASYAFYSAWDWRFCFLIVFSTAVDYWVGRLLERADKRPERRRLVAVSLTVNLGLLGYFKYAGFFSQSLRDLFALFDVALPALASDVILPVGISFYTFQTLSYVFDIYRRRVTPTHDFFDFALYVAFFPQLVAGPIERATTFLPQILERRSVDWERFSSGGWLIFWGVFKKVVIADNLAKLVDLVYSDASAPTSVEMLVGTYAFAFQIYCDFSGYTDIARGSARLMGFDLRLNFRLPFFALNPPDFWRRWHISLSTWFSDYVFVPLSFSRFLRARFSIDVTILLSLMITWSLVGLWHGAAWTFVVWGAYQGIILVAHRSLRPVLIRISPRSRPGRIAWSGLRMMAMFHLTCFGLLIFRAQSLAALMMHLSALTGPYEVGYAFTWLLPLGTLVAPLLLINIAQARSDDLEVVLRWPLAVRTSLYLLLGFMIVTLGEDGGQPFIYFQF